MEFEGQTALLRDRYLQALLKGDGIEAHRVVMDAMDRGADPTTIYLGILGPALVEIGNAWKGGKLSVAAEHHATSITLRQISYVGEVRRRSPRRDNGATVVVAAVAGEMHSVGVRMIADLFDFDGWNVVDLGPDNPTDDLVALVGERKPELVILSLSRRDRIPEAVKAVAMLKALDPGPAVFVGGPGASQEREQRAFDADLVSSSLEEALSGARQLLDITAGQVTLEDHLSSLGARVLELRGRRGWSQQELALRASLDRTYVSAVEKGKQNITIGAALRIADALDTSLSDLIDEG